MDAAGTSRPESMPVEAVGTGSVANHRNRGKAAAPPGRARRQRDRQLARLILRTASPVNRRNVAIAMLSHELSQVANRSSAPHARH
jgi:hypothetical protein